MACKENELAILKGTAGKLDDGTLIILSLMYHTEKDPSDPAGQRIARDKSIYRYEGRIVKIADLQKEIAEMETAPDAEWKWPGIEPWVIGYDGYMNNARGAKWLKDRVKKALPFAAFWRLASDGIKPNGKQSKTAGYELNGYVADGVEFTITNNPKALCENVGKVFSKIVK